MTERKFKVTIDDLNKNRKLSLDITDEDVYKKSLMEIIVDQLFKSAIPTPKEVKTRIAIDTTTLKVPSRAELETFIKSQPDYEYSIGAISNQFLGDNRSKLTIEEFANWDRGLRIKVKRVTQKIAESEKGHWEGKHIGGHKKVFKFVKDNGGEQLTAKDY